MGNKRISASFLLHVDFIGSYCEGPSAGWSAAPEQLLHHIIQVVLAIVPDCECIAVVGASDHGRQTWAHRQEVVRGGCKERQQVDRK